MIFLLHSDTSKYDKQKINKKLDEFNTREVGLFIDLFIRFLNEVSSAGLIEMYNF